MKLRTRSPPHLRHTHTHTPQGRAHQRLLIGAGGGGADSRRCTGWWRVAVQCTGHVDVRRVPARDARGRRRGGPCRRRRSSSSGTTRPTCMCVCVCARARARMWYSFASGATSHPPAQRPAACGAASQGPVFAVSSHCPVCLSVPPPSLRRFPRRARYSAPLPTPCTPLRAASHSVHASPRRSSLDHGAPADHAMAGCTSAP